MEALPCTIRCCVTDYYLRAPVNWMSSRVRYQILLKEPLATNTPVMEPFPPGLASLFHGANLLVSAEMPEVPSASLFSSLPWKVPLSGMGLYTLPSFQPENCTSRSVTKRLFISVRRARSSSGVSNTIGLRTNSSSVITRSFIERLSC